MTEGFPVNSGEVLQVVRTFFNAEGEEQLAQLFIPAEIEVTHVDYDNWDGGTYYYSLLIRITPSNYELIVDEYERLEEQILEAIHHLFRSFPNHHVTAVTVSPTLSRGDDIVSRDIAHQRVINSSFFVDIERINELKAISSSEFDLTKLIALCEELNICFTNGCYFAVTMLTRTILDHVPPIFEFGSFNEVANNYGGRSFKSSMKNLQNSSRNISDAHLHQTIRQNEILPNRIQVNFSNDLDVLLAEVVRRLN